MSRFRRFEIVDRRRPSYFIEQTIFSPPKTLFLDTPSPCFPAFPIPEDVLQFHTPPPFFFDEFDAVTELIQIETAPFRRVGLGELQLQALCDRVSDLELGFERLQREKKKKKLEEKKYSWTAEIGTAEKHRKYKWSTEIKGGEDEKKTYKLTAQIKGKGCPVERTYTVEVSSGKPKKNKVKKDNGKSDPRAIQIEEPSDHGAIVLRQVLFCFMLLYNTKSISKIIFWLFLTVFKFIEYLCYNCRFLLLEITIRMDANHFCLILVHC